MVVLVNRSVVDDGIVKNRDARSESIDSFSSTIDARDCGFGKNPGPADDGDGDVDDDRREEQLPRRALSSILVLDDGSRPEVRTLLEVHGGHLTDVGARVLEGLRRAAPSHLAARVGDYNENLSYEMRDADQDVGSIIRGAGGPGSSGGDDGPNSPLRRELESFEDSITGALRRRRVAYRGSFLRTETTAFQPAHVDYDHPVLRAHGRRLFLAFFPLTDEGAFLQLWRGRRADAGGVEEGTVVFIPRGKMLIVPAGTIHGGGFRRGRGGNLRFHLYIDAGHDDDGGAAAGEGDGKEIALLDHPMNRYTEEHDRRRELCERFVDADGLDDLLGAFFDV